MREEYLTLEEAIVVAGVRIIAVVRVSVHYVEIKGVRSFYAGKQPVYIIIMSTEGQRGYSVTGGEVTIQQAISDCPALAVVLEGWPGPPLPQH